MITNLTKVLGLAAAYYLTGRLGLLLAIPPGYASPVWPPAGLALASLLLFGYRVWPGIFLGQFLVDLGVPAGGSSLEPFFWIAASAGWTAIGATLQACLGAALIRRLVGFPTRLDEARDIAIFLVAGGPVACLLNATWSVTALAAQRAISWPAYPFNWLTWWTGDAIGVMVVTPLVLIWFAKPRETWRVRMGPVGVPLLAAFALCVVMFVKASAWDQNAIKFDFDQRAEALTNALRANLDSYLEDLYSIGSLFASAKVDRQAFHDFVARELSRHPGIKALEWIPRVTAAARGAYERAARNDGYPLFAINDQTGQSQVQAGPRSEYFPVYFVEPYRGNEAALGFDLASNPACRAALLQARDSGMVVATSRITLVQETANSFGVLLFLPVYNRGAPVATVEARRQNLLGFGLLVLRTDDFVHSAFTHQHLNGMQLRIDDESSPLGERLLWGSAKPGAGDVSIGPHGLTSETILSVGGRRWNIGVTPSPGLFGPGRSWQPWALLTISLFFTGLLGALLLIVTGRTLKTEALATENAKLSKRYRSLFEEVPAGLYRTTPDGKIVDANPALLHMLGYPSHEALTAVTAQDLYVSPEMRDELLVRLERHGTVIDFEGRVKRYDGSHVWFQTNARAVQDAAGRVVSYEGAIIDITKRKRAEARLEALNDIVVAAANAADLHAFLNTLVDRTLAVLDGEYGGVWLGPTGDLHVTRNMPPDLSAKLVAAAMAAGLDFTQVMVVEDWETATGPVADTLRPVLRQAGVSGASLTGPLLHEGRLIGGFAVATSQPHHWPADDVRLVEAIGRQVGTVAERLGLLDEVRAQAQDMEALYDVGVALRRVDSLDETYDIVAERVLAVLRADCAALVLLEPNGTQLRCARVRGVPAVPEGTVFPVAGSVSGVAIQQSSAFVTPDLSVEPPSVAAAAPGLGIMGPCVAVPMREQDRVIGVLFVARQRGTTLGSFTPRAVRLLTALAELASAVIDRAQLHDETKRQSAQLQALRDIDRAITGSLDLDLSLNVVLNKVTMELRVDAACVFLVNPHLQVLEPVANQGFHTTALRNIRIDFGDGLVGRSALERRRLSIDDLAETPDAVVIARSPLGRSEGFRAAYAVPLVAKGRLLGVLQVFSRRPMTPSEDWLAFLDVLAGQTAIAISDAQQLQALRKSNEDLVRAYDTTLAGWARALELRDKETEGHTQRVTEMTIRLASRLGMSDEDLVHIRRGVLLHDIGKMAVSDTVLLKPGPLSSEERAAMELHPVHAYHLLAPIPFLRPALDIPYCHHEKWDGTGYPRGLKGTDIPLPARIFSVIDVWDALTSQRPYRAAWGEQRARAYIKERAGTHFDPDVVDAFLRILEEGQFSRSSVSG